MARSAVQQALANARGWVNPYAPDVYRGRTDQGVDWIQSQPYLAPTAGTIAGIDPNWYKGTPAIYLKFDQPYIVPGTSRSYPGAFFAETSVLPGTRVGQRIEAGQPIAGGSAGGGLGEQGFAAPVGGAWRQAAYGQYTEGQQTQAGQDWLAAITGATGQPSRSLAAAVPGISAQAINTYLRNQGSPLAGQGQAFVGAGRRHGVDPALLVAISGAES